MIGGALLILAPFLAWWSIGFGISSTIDRNAFQLGESPIGIAGPACLVLGGFVLSLGIIRLTSTVVPRLLQRSTILAGLGTGIVAVLAAIQVPSYFVGSDFYDGQIGTGISVAIIGSVLAVAAGLVLRPASKTVSV